jgi:hypothetical protein
MFGREVTAVARVNTQQTEEQRQQAQAELAEKVRKANEDSRNNPKGGGLK